MSNLLVHILGLSGGLYDILAIERYTLLFCANQRYHRRMLNNQHWTLRIMRVLR